MYRTIVVPLDGSTTAEFALPVALAVAEASGGDLVLISAVARFPFHPPSPFGGDPPRGWHEEEFGRISHYLEETAGRLEAAGSGVPVQTEIDAGPPTQVLDERIRSLQADLVVMTTHGRGPLGRAWLGSVADGLLRRGPAPTLLVRPREGSADLSRRPRFKKILVPLDGSDLSEEAILDGVELARRFNGGVILVTVVPPPFSATSPYVPSVVEDEGTREAIFAGFRRYLEAMGEPVEKLGLLLETVVLEGRDVASGILEHGRRVGADLVVMSSRGRGGVARLVLGSVADKVVRSAAVPVLVHPQPREEDED